MIKELIHLGKLDEKYRYAEILVDITFGNEHHIFNKARAFIDTGASTSSINISYINDIIELSNYPISETGTAAGKLNCYELSKISLRLDPLFQPKQFIPLNKVKTIQLENGFDFLIGNDVLHMCEFTYNGLSKTYLLKMFQEI